MGFNWTENQEKIINHRSGDMLVSAGAGSGKTAVLTQHIVERVLDSEEAVDIDKLLVLTFTKAAAAEMKDRIRKNLEKRLEECSDDEELSGRIRRQLSLLNSATISTIDSFCQKILREQFYKVSLDPGFVVADESELKLLRADILQELLDRKYSEADESFIYLADRYSRVKSDGSLIEIIDNVVDRAVKEPDPYLWFDSMKGSRSTDWIAGETISVLKRLKVIVSQYNKVIELAVNRFIPKEYISDLKLDATNLESIIGGSYSSLDDLNRALSEFTFTKKKSAKQIKSVELFDSNDVDYIYGKNGPREKQKDAFKKLQEEISGYNQEIIELEEDEIGEVVDRIIDIAREYYTLFQEAKAKENQVDFSDMEQLVWKLFGCSGEKTETALEYAARFDEIMIDEYQDCNQIQEDILSAISKPESPDMFMVGDVKQSIYGFRGGKPDIFIDKQNRFKNDKDEMHRAIELRENFRSTVGILEGINEIFARLMTTDSCRINYSEDSRLNPDESLKPEVGPDIEIMLADTTTLPDGVTKKQAEARMVAAKIDELINGENKIQIIDRETRQYRYANYGDVAILLRSTSTNADDYINALNEYGIAAYSESEKGYFESLEVTETLCYLNILDNPYQDVEMLGVLRSGYYSFTADELAAIKLIGNSAGTTWLYDSLLAVADNSQKVKGIDEGLVKKIEGFIQDYTYFREKSVVVPISELLGEMFDITGYNLYALSIPGGKKRVQNLNMLRVKARDYELTRFRGIFKFLRYIEQLKTYEQDIQTPSLSDKSAVAIMTIHKSKGLEFPICFVSRMGAKFNELDARGDILFDEDLGLATNIVNDKLGYRKKPLKKTYTAKLILEKQKVEELRLLYVAMTRAKDRLILTGSMDNPKETCEGLTSMVSKALPALLSESVFSCNKYIEWVIMAVMHLEMQSRESGHSGIADHLEMDFDNGRTRISFRSYSYDMIPKRIEKEEATVYTKTAELPDELLEALNRIYPYQNECNIHSVYTVSELKKTHYEAEEEPDYVRKLISVEKPEEAMNKDGKLTGADRGNAYHHVAERIDYASLIESSPDELVINTEKEINRIYEQGLITDKEAETVSAEDYAKLLSQPMGRRMAEADKQGNLLREQEFVFAAYPQEIEELKFKESSDEKVLIQGIIDAVFREGEEWIIVDYKTDRVNHKTGAEELINKYSAQLDYYKKAWEDITNQRVCEMYLYSFELGNFIKL